MKIKYEFPPNYEKILMSFDIPTENNRSIVFTYGDILYVPRVGGIPAHLMAHEVTHSKQQGSNTGKWNDEYIINDMFRLNQELEAYRNQYKYFCNVSKDRNQRFFLLHKISKDLSGSLYKNIISYNEAKKQIKNTY